MLAPLTAREILWKVTFLNYLDSQCSHLNALSQSIVHGVWLSSRGCRPGPMSLSILSAATSGIRTALLPVTFEQSNPDNVKSIPCRKLILEIVTRFASAIDLALKPSNEIFSEILTTSISSLQSSINMRPFNSHCHHSNSRQKLNELFLLNLRWL